MLVTPFYLLKIQPAIYNGTFVLLSFFNVGKICQVYHRKNFLVPNFLKLKKKFYWIRTYNSENDFALAATVNKLHGW